MQVPLLADPVLVGQLTALQRDLLSRIAQMGRCSVLTFATATAYDALQVLLALHLLEEGRGGTSYHLTAVGWQIMALL